MAEAEGALSSGFEGEKRQAANFILWNPDPNPNPNPDPNPNPNPDPDPDPNP